VTNLVTWVVTIITVLFLTPLFKTLPKRIGRADHPRGLAYHRLGKLLKIRRVAVEFWFGALALAACCWWTSCRDDHRGGGLADLRVYKSSRPHVSSLGGCPRARRLLGPGPAS